MQILLASGISSSTINYRRRHGDLRNVGRGMYATDDAWESRLAAHVLRGGRDAVASHRSAARLHGLDGFRDTNAIDLIVAGNSSYRRAPAMRSTISEADRRLAGGIACTSLARTLADLGRFATADLVELAVEAGLRGTDPRRPGVEMRVVGNVVDIVSVATQG